MVHACRMGHAPALDYLPLEAKPAHRAPQRQRLTAEEEERRRAEDVPPIDIGMVVALARKMLDDGLVAKTVDQVVKKLVEPSAPKFKAGDLVRPTYKATWTRGRVIEVEAETGKVWCEYEGKPGSWWDWPDALEPLPPPAPTGVWRSGKPEREGRYKVRNRQGKVFDGAWVQPDSGWWDIDGGWHWLDTPQEPEAAS